jgi:AMMECR1 domain-containing protein
MVVEEPNGNSLEIECTVYNRWSHCRSLPVKQSFQARIGKHGVEIRYLDQHGKMRKQVYEIVSENGKKAS